MSTVFVDFNDREGDGRYAALVPAREVVAVGDEVVAADGEGTSCIARVDELLRSGRVAMVRVIEGSWDRDSKVRVTLQP